MLSAANTFFYLSQITDQAVGDGVALINYMKHMSKGDGDSDSDEDLKPSAEDLEIFAEIERDMEERQARIDRGETPVDPMVNIIV